MISINPTWIAYIGTFPPRECGIATFTKDLIMAMEDKFSPSIKSKIIVMNNQENFIDYDNNKDVLFEIHDENISSYIEVAKKVNKIEKIKLINIQHEFGIFGGENGKYLLHFIKHIKKPFVITFHSVIPNPADKLKDSVKKLTQKASGVVVLTQKGIEILQNDYDVDNNIVVIPHGTPNVIFQPSKQKKAEMGLNARTVLSTFGLINSGKGFEYVLDALPEVVKKFPEVIYLIIGATHPNIKKKEGESYREFLKNKIDDLKLGNNVKFINKYLTLEELVNHLLATDIYISSGLNPDQIVSGTLAYAMACGRVVVSTPFIHAKDIATPERGFLVKFKDSKSYQNALIRVLSNKALKEKMAKNAYAYTRHFTWPNVAIAYYNLFKKIVPQLKTYTWSLPEIKFDYINKLTDDFGIIQFANHVTPDPNSGYTLDDNARALFMSTLHYNLFQEDSSIKLIETYLNFIKYVLKDNHKLYNIVDNEKNIDLNDWSEDAQGRAIMALGYLIASPDIPLKLKQEAEILFNESKVPVCNFNHLRGIAFSLIGFYYYQTVNNIEIEQIETLADFLVRGYNNSSTKTWKWFETALTYSNSKIPEALFLSYEMTGERQYFVIAKESLDFLISTTFYNGFFEPIGQNGWFYRNKSRSYFDQQPVDTACMVQTLITVYELTKEKRYKEFATKTFEWFLGKNYLSQEVYNRITGGCHDGIGKVSLNQNLGAESSIVYMLARLAIHSIKEEKYPISILK